MAGQIATPTQLCEENRNQQTITKLCEVAGSLCATENARQIEEQAEWQELERLVACVTEDKAIALSHRNEAERRAQANRDRHELARLVQLAQLEKLAQSLLIERNGGFQAAQLHEAQAERAMLTRMSKLLELEKLSAAHYKIRQSALIDAAKKELNELQRVDQLVALEVLSAKHFSESQVYWREARAEQAALEEMCQLAALEQNTKCMLNAAQYAQLHHSGCGRDHNRHHAPACGDCKTSHTAHTAKQVRLAGAIKTSAQFLKSVHKWEEEVQHQSHHQHADSVLEATHDKSTTTNWR